MDQPVRAALAVLLAALLLPGCAAQPAQELPPTEMQYADYTAEDGTQIGSPAYETQPPEDFGQAADYDEQPPVEPSPAEEEGDIAEPPDAPPQIPPPAGEPAPVQPAPAADPAPYPQPQPAVPSPQPPVSTPPVSINAFYIGEVVRLVNLERERAGLKPLEVNHTLVQAAQIRAGELPHSFSHNRPNGRRWSTVLDEVGLDLFSWGENIAYGQQTPAAVVADWMDSPTHRENILRERFTLIGVGFHQDERGRYHWVQLFGEFH
ncbi:MAG: CAP domain-containing protein [Oscillospiraceae bacterium]|nr:CAP domain-containing protein [Oscillospiraceae bacterium]